MPPIKLHKPTNPDSWVSRQTFGEWSSGCDFLLSWATVGLVRNWQSITTTVAWWPTLRDLKKGRRNWDINLGCASHHVVIDNSVAKSCISICDSKSRENPELKYLSVPISNIDSL